MTIKLAGLDVAVDDVLARGRSCKTLGGLEGDVQRLFQLQGTLGFDLVLDETLAFEEGHGEEGLRPSASSIS